MIISISGEYGGNSHHIGELVAEKLGITLYKKENLIAEAKKKENSEELCAFFEETPINSLLYVIATTSYNAGKQSEAPFAFVREIASRGPCVIIGRAGNYILRDNPEHVSVFIHSSVEARLERIVNEYGIPKRKAMDKLEQEDKDREAFHKYYTDEMWCNSQGYDLCINSEGLTTDDAADIIIEFAKRKVKQ